ncbi:MAG: hypothetical protein HXY27_07840 [Hydrogenophilaceae bacterium]|nr:hypothetical protein [Hydrogenophilaceae bacterium]
MKTLIIALSLLCMPAIAVSGAQPMTEPASQAQDQMSAQQRARLKQRDMRHCLEKKSNRDIHRCAVGKNTRK